MIESFEFKNFKSLRSAKLRGLQRLTVIVGPSGVGKTSVLQGLHLFSGLGVHQYDEEGYVLRRPGKIFQGRWAPERLATRGEPSFEMATHGGSEVCLRATLAKVPPRDLPTFSISIPGKALELPAGRDTASEFFADPVFRELGSSVLLNFSVDRLGSESLATTAPAPWVFSDGSGLATVLVYLAAAQRESLQSIEQQLRAVLGVTGRIRVLPMEMEIEEWENVRIDSQLIPRTIRRKAAGYRFEVEYGQLGFIPSDLLSEGTLVTLGLLTVLHQPECPRLLLLDDIDQGLHPMAQAKLIASLKGILAERPDVQIIATSHSPYLIDHLEPEEVQVMSFDAHGGGVAARLDSHPDWPEWKGTLQTGEFWSSVGESWVAGETSDER